MEIEVRLYGALQRYRPAGAAETGYFKMAASPGITAGGVAEQLGIPGSWVRSCFVNGELSKKDRILSPGDQVALLPPAGGGTMESGLGAPTLAA